MKDTRVFAGIDEAGLGPLLGPLTLGWSAFRSPRDKVDLWKRLSRIVSDNPTRDRDRLIVADSKKVYSRTPRGRRRLELTALSFLAQLDPEGQPPTNGRAIVEFTPESLAIESAAFDRHPWYASLPDVPHHVPADRLALRSGQLGRQLERQEVTLLEAGVRVMPAGELNKSFDDTENKALSHWQLVSGVVRHLWDLYAEEGLSLFVDRLGGRHHYTNYLTELLPGAEVRLFEESDGYSEYHVHQGEGEGERRMRIAFAERCEERSFAVALASCLAKYARELSMEAFNEYFGGLQEGLEPTAGYTQDGRRWLQEAGPALERSGVDRSTLVRKR